MNDTSGINETMEKLTHERDELKKILETLEDGFIETDLRGDITRYNNAFCELVGYPASEAMGLSYRVYMDKVNAENVYKTFNKVYKTKVPNKAFDYEIIRKEGVKRNVEISIAVLQDTSGRVDGFRCIMRDVTLRKQAEAEIVRQRGRLEAIFRSVEDAIITVDPEFNIVEINDAALKVCGIAGDSHGNCFFNVHNDACNRSCRDVLDKVISKRSVVRNYQIKCEKDSDYDQRVSVSCTPLESIDGAFSGAVLVIRDMTRIFNLERALGKRNRFQAIIGESRGMQEIYKLVEDISDYEATVLITGESGTGKELVARAIHNSGGRSGEPFVTVNCSALSENLLESELFGHVKGAFTGAFSDNEGRFQKADKGTILLDEIGDISQLIQLKLLRVLQEKEFEKVGSSNSVKVDVRVIACTHQDLDEKVRLGEFREDLYYRLKVLEVTVPPLRDRPGDIPLLINHFVSQFEKKFKLPVEGISEAVLANFMHYRWPGNIRELEHAIERAVILSRGGHIELSHIPADIKNKSKISSGGLKNLKNESDHIITVLERTGGNKAKAARIIGVSRKTLYKKLKKYNIV